MANTARFGTKDCRLFAVCRLVDALVEAVSIYLNVSHSFSTLASLAHLGNANLMRGYATTELYNVLYILYNIAISAEHLWFYGNILSKSDNAVIVLWKALTCKCIFPPQPVVSRNTCTHRQKTSEGDV